MDLKTGALTAQGTVAAGASPTNLALHPNSKFLYVGNEETAGAILAFSINPATGALTMLNRASSAGQEPAHISVHKSGNWLLASNYADGTVAALPISADGRLGTAVAPRVAGSNAHMILDDGVTGNFVFVPCAAADLIAQYRFDPARGRLEPSSPPTVAVASKSRPRHMAFHPSGKAAYLTYEAIPKVTAFKYDPETGQLSMPTDAAAAVDGAHALVHPNGQFLYTLMRGANKLSIFDIDAAGVLKPASDVPGFSMPYDFALSRDGKYSLVVNAGNSTIKPFGISADTGTWTPMGAGATATEQPHSVVITVF
jgi:6-phosphogluconolactonase